MNSDTKSKNGDALAKSDDKNGNASAKDSGKTVPAQDSGDFDLDKNLLHLGIDAFYPTGLYFVVCMFIFMSPSQYLSAHLCSFTPQHHCSLPDAIDVADAIPKEVFKGREVFAKCSMFPNMTDISNRSALNNSLSSPTANTSFIPCDRGWDYVNSTPGDSIVTEWDLVCSQGWIPSFTTAIFNVGQAFGGLLVQPLGDKYGRKWILVISMCGLGLSGIVIGTLVYDVITYIVFRFINGVFFSAFLLASFVMLIELYAAKHRMYAGMVVEPIWGCGSAAVALAVYLFPQWRHLMVFCSAPFFISLVMFCIFPPDTLPWLMVNGRHEEVRKYLEERLKKKGKKLLLLTDEEIQLKEKAEAKSVVIETPKQMLTNFQVLKQLVILSFISTVNSLVFYALSLSSTDLSGDKHMNLFLSGVVEIPGYALAGVTLHFMGRRGPAVLFHVVVGVFMGIVAAIDMSGQPLTAGWDMFSQICYFGAKLCISGSYAIVFLFTSEIFPTNVRNTCVGIVDAVARAGGVLAPFSSNLGAVYAALPTFIFAILALVAAILILFLPECHDERLPDNLEDLQYLVEGTRFWSMRGKRKKLKKRRRTISRGVFETNI